MMWKDYVAAVSNMKAGEYGYVRFTNSCDDRPHESDDTKYHRDRHKECADVRIFMLAGGNHIIEIDGIQTYVPFEGVRL